MKMQPKVLVESYLSGEIDLSLLVRRLKITVNQHSITCDLTILPSLSKYSDINEKNLNFPRIFEDLKEMILLGDVLYVNFYFEREKKYIPVFIGKISKIKESFNIQREMEIEISAISVPDIFKSLTFLPSIILEAYFSEAKDNKISGMTKKIEIEVLESNTIQIGDETIEIKKITDKPPEKPKEDFIKQNLYKIFLEKFFKKNAIQKGNEGILNFFNIIKEIINNLSKKANIRNRSEDTLTGEFFSKYFGKWKTPTLSSIYTSQLGFKFDIKGIEKTKISKSSIKHSALAPIFTPSGINLSDFIKINKQYIFGDYFVNIPVKLTELMTKIFNAEISNAQGEIKIFDFLNSLVFIPLYNLFFTPFFNLSDNFEKQMDFYLICFPFLFPSNLEIETDIEYINFSKIKKDFEEFYLVLKVEDILSYDLNKNLDNVKSACIYEDLISIQFKGLGNLSRKIFFGDNDIFSIVSVIKPFEVEFIKFNDLGFSLPAIRNTKEFKDYISNIIQETENLIQDDDKQNNKIFQKQIQNLKGKVEIQKKVDEKKQELKEFSEEDIGNFINAYVISKQLNSLLYTGYVSFVMRPDIFKRLKLGGVIEFETAFGIINAEIVAYELIWDFQNISVINIMFQKGLLYNIPETPTILT
ncbi:MAG: hypothetical protein ABIL45_03840 [candidate division WOR-3 bacterium]